MGRLWLLDKNNWLKVWRILKKYVYLQRQNEYFDYAAECGEQGLIDTAPFKSHLRMAFIFHIAYGIVY